MAKGGIGVVALCGNPFCSSQRSLLVALSARYSLPSMFEFRQFAEAGGLLTYGPSIEEVYRQLGVYAAAFSRATSRRSTRCATTKFDLVINLETAKRLD